MVIDQVELERPSKGLLPLGSQRAHMKIDRKISNTITIPTMIVTFFLEREEEEARSWDGEEGNQSGEAWRPAG